MITKLRLSYPSGKFPMILTLYFSLNFTKYETTVPITTFNILKLFKIIVLYNKKKLIKSTTISSTGMGIGNFCLNLSFMWILTMYKNIIETIEMISVAMLVLDIFLKISIKS